jgi:hypothetical protein
MVLMPAERVIRNILVLRGRRVILAPDLAVLYGVETRRLNEQVGRNLDRFPGDFMFRLTREELAEVVAICDNPSKIKHAPKGVLAFTEHGAIGAAFVLNSAQAVQMSVAVIRAFVQLREAAQDHEELARRLDRLETATGKRFDLVQQAIAELAEWSHRHPSASISVEGREGR